MAVWWLVGGATLYTKAFVVLCLSACVLCSHSSSVCPLAGLVCLLPLLCY